MYSLEIIWEEHLRLPQGGKKTVKLERYYRHTVLRLHFLKVFSIIQ